MRLTVLAISGICNHARNRSRREKKIEIAIIDDVMPLEAGADEIAPTTLYESLWGQPDNVNTLMTYALLDAAKIQNLPEMLEASGLEHRCLFKGSAYEDLKNVAPWLVRLENGTKFTRNLFKKPKAPWHLWEAEPGIYVRSPKTIDDIQRHLRKFTRVQNEPRKWDYFRFWEPACFFALAQACYESGKVGIANEICAGNTVCAILPSEAKVMICKGGAATPNYIPRLTVNDIEALKKVRWTRFVRLASKALQDDGFEVSYPDVEQLCAYAIKLGFSIEQAVWLVVRALLKAPELTSKVAQVGFDRSTELQTAETIMARVEQEIAF